MLLICMKKQAGEWSNADFHFNFLFCAEFAVDKEASVSVYIYILPNRNGALQNNRHGSSSTKPLRQWDLSLRLII
mgnify:CR=1 FL=1